MSTLDTDIRARHARHYLDRLNAIETRFKEGGDRIPKALEELEEHLTNIHRALNWAAQLSPPSEHCEIATGYFRLNDGVLALRWHRADRLRWIDSVLPLLSASGSQKFEGRAHTALGDLHTELGQPGLAVPHFEQALLIARAVGDRTGEAFTLSRFGWYCHMVSDFSRAIELLEQSLAICIEQRDSRSEMRVRSTLGLAYSDVRNRTRSIENVDRAISLARDLGATQDLSGALNNRALIHQEFGEHALAIEHFAEALECARRVGDVQYEANIMSNLGKSYAELGHYAHAVEMYEAALPLMKQTGVSRNEARTLGKLGNALAALEQSDLALMRYEQALVISERVNDADFQCTLLHWIGFEHLKQHRSTEAIRSFEKGLEAAERLKHLGRERFAYEKLAEAYEAAGNPTKALEQRLQALTIARQLDDKELISNTLYGVATLCYSIQEYELALRIYREELAMVQAQGSRASEATTWNRIGDTLFNLKRYEEALDAYRVALEMASQLENTRTQAMNHTDIGDVLRAQEKYAAAAQHYQRAIALEPERSFAHSGLALIAHAQERYDDAIALFRKALDLNPEATNTRLNLVLTLRAASRTEELASELSRLEAAALTESTLTRACIAAQSGHSEGAVALLTQGLERRELTVSALRDDDRLAVLAGHEGFARLLCRAPPSLDVLLPDWLRQPPASTASGLS